MLRATSQEKSFHLNFAEGGSIRGAMSTSGVAGAHGLTADIANNFSPTTKVDVKISERALLNAMDGTIKSQVNTYIDKAMFEKAKLHSQMMKLVW